MKAKHSSLGVVSFFMGVGCSLLLTFLLSLVLMLGTLMDANPGDSIMFYVFVVALFLGNIVALVLGIVSLFQKERRRLWGILGTVFSAGMLYINFSLYLLLSAHYLYR